METNSVGGHVDAVEPPGCIDADADRSAECCVVGRDAAEQETHRAYRWWALTELAQSQELFLPPGLPRLLAPLLSGDIPGEPLQLAI